MEVIGQLCEVIQKGQALANVQEARRLRVIHDFGTSTSVEGQTGKLNWIDLRRKWEAT